jgi:hypothetical protein
MNEKLYELVEKLILNTITDSEKMELDKLILDNNNQSDLNLVLEELKGYYKLPLGLELQNIAPHLKNSLLKTVKQEQQIKLAKQLTLRYRNLFYSACAMLLIGFVYVALTNINQNSQNNLGKSDLVNANQETTNINKELVLANHIIQNSMCNHISEYKMNTNIKSKGNYGKVYVNNKIKTITLHICRLEKIANNECFLLWAKDKEGNFKAITSMMYDHEFKEENFVINVDLTAFNETEFVLTVEQSNTPIIPSEIIAMKSVQI